tara:strand:- start:76 stop:531 length:456 start_codon:yes stop_codon:yes gene_type:complete
MASIKENRMFRAQQGKLPSEIGQPESFKADEFEWIPFFGNNPEGDKPYTYSGRFTFSSEQAGMTTINCTGKRNNGTLEVTISGDDRVAEYFGVASHRFSEAIFNDSSTPAKGAKVVEKESEIEKLKGELIGAQRRIREMKEKQDKLKDMLK